MSLHTNCEGHFSTTTEATKDSETRVISLEKALPNTATTVKLSSNLNNGKVTKKETIS